MRSISLRAVQQLRRQLLRAPACDDARDDGTVERLPIPTAEVAPAACREIAGLARLLARRRDPTALARLNARVAGLYQLSAAEFEHILSTFPLIPQTERDEALRLFSATTQR
jgi:hypothetical protein